VLAHFVHNDRLIDALLQPAFCALTASPGARAYYDALRSRGMSYNAALRQLSNRLVASGLPAAVREDHARLLLAAVRQSGELSDSDGIDFFSTLPLRVTTT
jgi:hypothetical protein